MASHSTAMAASVAALKACGVKRVLSVSPFDGPLIDGIRKYIQDRGVDAVSAPQTVPVYTDAPKLTSDEVFDLTRRAFESAGPVDGIYFQGLVLNPCRSWSAWRKSCIPRWWQAPPPSCGTSCPSWATPTASREAAGCSAIGPHSASA